ncbi:MAG: prolyl oligopeptidase family serine peptidase, partial [Ferruginibacter sp.]
MKYFLLLIIFLNFFQAKSQNGKIIDQVPFELPDSIKVRDAKYFDWKLIETVNFYHITYLSDGLKVKGYMSVPKQSGKYPCIIYNRGGNRENSAISDYAFIALQGYLSYGGYVVVASQYRGNAGGEGKEEFGGKDIDDVLNLFPLLNHVENADTSKIGMMGGSRGGMMTYLALTKTNLIKAAVVISGIGDFKQALEHTNFNADNMFYNWLPEYRENKESFIKKRSPIEFANDICKTTPIFIVQGTGDGTVTTPQVFDLAK